MSTPRSHQASRDSANAENLLGESPTPRRSVLLATPRAASLQKGSLQQLTPTERRYVLMSRCGAVLLRCGFALGSTATLSRKLELVGGNIRAYAAATANVQSAISASQLLLAPTVGALSDSLGRRPLQLASSIAMMFWHLFLANRRLCNSIFRYQAFGVLCMGVCSAGSMTVRQAALADLFGSRPSIAAQIESQNMFWVSTVGMFAPLVGAEIARRAPNLALRLAAAVCVLQLPLIFFMPETLTKQERKPLRGSLKFSNPLSNVAVLFSNGPGLRGLAIVNVLYAGCNGAYFPTELAVAQCTQYLGHPHYHHRLLSLPLLCHAGAFANISEYAMGSCGWVPADISYLNSGQGFLSAFAFRQVFPRMLRRFGAKGAFQLGSLASASALLLLSQAWRGGSKLWCTSLIALAFVIQVPGMGNPVALRTITTKQGLSVAKTSRCQCFPSESDL